MTTSLTLKIFRRSVISCFLGLGLIQTPYIQRKLEKGVSALLYYRLEKSQLLGLRSISLSHWHIDRLKLNSNELGLIEASNIDFSLKLSSLIFGKVSFAELRIQSLELKTPEGTPIDPKIFAMIYEKNFIPTEELYVDLFQTSLIKEPFAVSFIKKPRLNFLEVNLPNLGHSYYFEIQRNLPYLKFKTALTLEFQESKLNLEGKGEIIEKAVFDLEGSLKLPISEDLIHLTFGGVFDGHLQSEGAFHAPFLEGLFKTDSNRLLCELSLLDFAKFWKQGPIKGHLDLGLSGSLDSLEIHGKSNELYLGRKIVAPLEFTANLLEKTKLQVGGAFLKNDPLEVNFSLAGQCIDSDLSGHFEFKGKPFEMTVESTATKNLGFLNLKTLHTAIQVHDLNFFEGLFDKLFISGEGMMALDWDEKKNHKAIWGVFNKLKVNEYSLDQARIDFSDSDSLGHIQVNLNALKTPFSDPLTYKLKGDKKEFWDGVSEFSSPHLTVAATHRLSIGNKEFLFHLQEVQGRFFNEPIHLEKPVLFEKKVGGFQISPIHLSTSKTDFSYEGFKNSEHFYSRLNLSNLPLIGLKIPHFDLPLQGHLNLNAVVDSKSPTSNRLDLDLDHVILKSASPLFPPLYVRSSLNQDPKGLSYKLSSYFTSEDTLHLEGHLPWSLDSKGSFQKTDGASFLTLLCQYDLKDLGRFVDFGSNTLGGKVDANLSINLGPKPFFVSGHVRIEDLYAGFPLLGIYGDKGTFIFHPSGKKGPFTLSLNDLQGGKGEAQGVINLENQTYEASVSFKDFYLKIKDLFESTISGTLNAQGSPLSIYAKGPLDVQGGKYELIHEELSRKKIYSIEKQIQDLPLNERNHFEYTLDFDLFTKTPLKITGAGLDSDWVGQSQCHYSQKSFDLEGTLQCHRGDFKFSSKKFIIDEGTITLSEKNPSTIVAKGHLDLAAYQIKILLLGPLAEPTLSFSSLPYLSEKAIFSYILFNKPPMELHPYQSLELAQTLMELSGDKTPFSLGFLKSSLNIDTLELISGESTKNPLTLRVGKYLTPGFLVALTQNTQTSDMLVQLELKHGFLIKAESKEQKDGKFSLSWHTNF